MISRLPFSTQGDLQSTGAGRLPPRIVEPEVEEDDGAVEREAEERAASERAEQEAKEARERKEKQQQEQRARAAAAAAEAEQRGRSKIARHVNAKSVRDGSVRRKKPTRLAERDERQGLQQRPLVRPSPHLRDANLWRDVRTVVPTLI